MNLPKKDLTIAQKSDLIKKIGSVDLETRELIFALIKCYSLDNGIDVLSIPYGGVLTKDRIEFDLLEFPIGLRQLLYKFMVLHHKRLAEDRELKDYQKEDNN